MSPAELEVLLWSYYSAQPYECWDSDGYRDTVAKFQEMGILESDPDRLNCQRTTRKGRAWVKAILDTPVPLAAFVSRDGRILSTEEDHT